MMISSIVFFSFDSGACIFGHQQPQSKFKKKTVISNIFAGPYLLVFLSRPLILSMWVIHGNTLCCVPFLMAFDFDLFS